VTYQNLGRHEQALQIEWDVYSGRLKLNGKEHEDTVGAALNYASSLIDLKRFKQAKSLLRKTTPVARRVLGESNELTLKMRRVYAAAFYMDAGATLDDVREAVDTLEDAERTARQVLGSAHPLTTAIERSLKSSRRVLAAHEALDSYQRGHNKQH